MKFRRRGDKLSAKIPAVDDELTALRGVVRCILDYELHNQLSPTYLIWRTEILEKEKRVRKSIVPDYMERKMCAPDESVPLNLERNFSGAAQSSNPLPNSRGDRKRSTYTGVSVSRATRQQQNLEKRPKTAADQTAEASDMSTRVAPQHRACIPRNHLLKSCRI